MQADIRTYSTDQLKTYLEGIGEKPFRAQQIYEWLWKGNVSSFEEMTNLAKDLRQKLHQDFVIRKITIAQSQRSADGTIKFGFRLWDDNLVEGVLIPTTSRMTACVSSQVGCSLTCKFCATGYMDLRRNLQAYEIYDQVVLIREQAQFHYQAPLTNIVYMGMGEPLLNYKNVYSSIQMVNSPQGLGMAAERITLSTAGIAKMIKKLADDGFRSEFALSLHAANDEKRNQIMPINESNSIEALKDALRYFYQKTKTRVTYEYIIFQDFNDSLQDAQELYDFAKTIPCKINILEYNPIQEASFRFTSQKRLEDFKSYLENKGLVVNVRRSRGRDVDGACGQLASKVKPTLQ